MKKEKENNKKMSTALLLSILGVVSLVLITAGVTFAFFSYTKEGQTENVIKTGSLTFAYDETQANGAGIRIEDALPITDIEGKGLSGAGKVFNFTVTSTTTTNTQIDYIVTARKTASSTIDSKQVKLWLDVTPGTGEVNETIDGAKINTFDKLASVGSTSSNAIAKTITAPAGTEERIIYTGVVPKSSKGATAYNKSFTLKMWLNGEDGDANSVIADYSPYEYVAISETSATVQEIAAAYCKDSVGATVSGVTDETTCTATAGNIWVPAVRALVADPAKLDALDAEALITAGKLITSEKYYDGTTVKNDYERIMFVSEDKNNAAGTSRTVFTRSQALANNNAEVDALGNYSLKGVQPTGYSLSEQYYQLNGQTFTITVNVYANGATVSNTGGTSTNP